jgi:hypothetical protein
LEETIVNHRPARLAAGAVTAAVVLSSGAPLVHAETEGDEGASESSELVLPPGELTEVQPSSGDYTFTIGSIGETVDEPGEPLESLFAGLAAMERVLPLPG